MKTIVIIISAASLLGLAGCGTNKPLSPDFGNATQHNMAVQVVNPDASTQPPVYDGTHTAEAVKRYRTGGVKEPEPIETTGNK